MKKFINIINRPRTPELEIYEGFWFAVLLRAMKDLFVSDSEIRDDAIEYLSSGKDEYSKFKNVPFDKMAIECYVNKDKNFEIAIKTLENKNSDETGIVFEEDEFELSEADELEIARMVEEDNVKEFVKDLILEQHSK